MSNDQNPADAKQPRKQDEALSEDVLANVTGGSRAGIPKGPAKTDEP